jgi:hypothetical protein
MSIGGHIARKPHPATDEDDVPIGRRDVYDSSHRRDPILRRHRSQAARLGQDHGKHLGAFTGKVQHNDYRRREILRQAADDRLQRFDTTGRSADHDHTARETWWHGSLLRATVRASGGNVTGGLAVDRCPATV